VDSGLPAAVLGSCLAPRLLWRLGLPWESWRCAAARPASLRWGPFALIGVGSHALGFIGRSESRSRSSPSTASRRDRAGGRDEGTAQVSWSDAYRGLFAAVMEKGHVDERKEEQMADRRTAFL